MRKLDSHPLIQCTFGCKDLYISWGQTAVSLLVSVYPESTSGVIGSSIVDFMGEHSYQKDIRYTSNRCSQGAL